MADDNTKNPSELLPQPVPDEFKGGLKRPEVTTGAIDPLKARIAKKSMGAGGFGMGGYGGGGRSIDAGMLLDNVGSQRSHNTGFALEGYKTSYANGMNNGTGTYDVPSYFVTMNEQNGGILYWPATLHEKYQWYRYWARTDAYIGRALELLSDLPMSKLTLNMPKMKDKKKSEEMKQFFEYQMERLNMFELCQGILWEMNMIGNCFIFHEWDAKEKMWSRAVMLPPEEVYIFNYPFGNSARVEYKPERLISLIQGDENAGDWADQTNNEYFGESGFSKTVADYVPKEIVKMVKKEGAIIMDTDPMTGSFVHHVSRRRSLYHDLGASVLERVLVPMLMKEHFRYTQLSLSSRNMTPKNLITAAGLMENELGELRTQVDLSYMDPDYTIMTNYDVTWEQIGAQDRLLDLDREYERIENQVFAGLGVTRELLTGEGSFSGNKITIDILNSMFLLTRNVITNYIEKQLFVPICEARGWYETNKYGVKNYLHPKIGFNRLTIRDNAELFDSLYQLHVKGGLPIEPIWEMFDLNADEMESLLRENQFTVKDPNYNRLVEDVLSETGRSLVERTDIVDKQAKYLGLELKAPEEEGGAGFGDFGGGGGDFQFGEESPAEGAPEGAPEGNGAAEPTNRLEDFATDIAESLPDDASDEQIDQAVEQAAGNSEPKTEE